MKVVDCIIPKPRFKMYLEVSALVKVVDCIIPEPRLKMYPEASAPVKVVDYIIPEPRFKMYQEVLALVKVVGLYHPGTSVQNRSGDFGLRECGGIASSLNFGSKCIRRSRPPRMWWDCIIPEPWFKMYP